MSDAKRLEEQAQGIPGDIAIAGASICLTALLASKKGTDTFEMYKNWCPEPGSIFEKLSGWLQSGVGRFCGKEVQQSLEQFEQARRLHCQKFTGQVKGRPFAALTEAAKDKIVK